MEESMAPIRPSVPIERLNIKIKQFLAQKFHFKKKPKGEDPPMILKKSLSQKPMKKIPLKDSLLSNTGF